MSYSSGEAEAMPINYQKNKKKGIPSTVNHYYIKDKLPGWHQQDIQTKWTPTPLKQKANQLLPSELSQESLPHQNLHHCLLPATIAKEMMM